MPFVGHSFTSTAQIINVYGMTHFRGRQNYMKSIRATEMHLQIYIDITSALDLQLVKPPLFNYLALVTAAIVCNSAKGPQ